jgi:hypothetical protein
MIANKLWLVYLRNFPGFEEVERTEKYMRNAYVVPKTFNDFFTAKGATIPSVSYLQLKGEISK